MAGLDPAILHFAVQKRLDHRVKPGDDKMRVKRKGNVCRGAGRFLLPHPLHAADLEAEGEAGQGLPLHAGACFT
jgi:hypothetical protein